MKNISFVNYLINNHLTEDQSKGSLFWVTYLDTDCTVQADQWTMRTLWDEIRADEVHILSLEQL